MCVRSCEFPTLRFENFSFVTVTLFYVKIKCINFECSKLCSRIKSINFNFEFSHQIINNNLYFVKLSDSASSSGKNFGSSIDESAFRRSERMKEKEYNFLPEPFIEKDTSEKSSEINPSQSSQVSKSSEFISLSQEKDNVNALLKSLGLPAVNLTETKKKYS